jgi:CheY-like chemotaxis protein
MRPLAVRGHQKGLEVMLRYGSGVPDRLMGDPGRLRQIIVNLVGNAIKFTESGEIEVTVRLATEQAGPHASIAFSVRDTGIGIPADKLQSIFESFSQADTSTTRRYGGTGLGLTISSQLVGLMGGHITVQSTLGVGSTFGFTIDLPFKDSLPAANYRGSDPLPGLRVLVVDDNPTSAQLLSAMLRDWKIDAVLAHGGAQAIDELARAAGQGEAFAVTLIDTQMPNMSGFELLEYIRRTHADVAGAPVMLLAPDRQREDAARCHELGIAVHLAKPVAQPELFSAILRALGEVVQPSVRPDRRQAPRAPQRVLQILVAEDNAVNQTLALRLLEKLGHRVTLAHNGIEAVRQWMDGEFDAILMDVDMPLMNGHQATRRIRDEEAAEGAGRHVPIVAMTAHAMEGARESCLASGMDAYLAKPIDTKALWRALDTIAVGVVATASAFSAEQATEAGATLSADFTKVRAAMGDDAELFDELRSQFLADAPTLLAQVLDAQSRGDREALRASTHALKGIVGIFSADPATQACLRVEEQAGSPGAAEAVSALSTTIDRLLIAIRDYQWPSASDEARP